MKSKEASHLPPTHSLDVRKVLIADDDETTRILLRLSLLQWGYQVFEASDGEEAWKILCEPDPPQILILDWLMPNLDGIALCKRIESELTSRPYIIFLTGMAGTENMIQGLEAGADEFILKPFDLAELRIRVFAGERIIKYRQQIEAQNKKLQTYIAQMKQSAVEYINQNFSAPDLIKLLQEINEALNDMGTEDQRAKILEWQGKVNNFIDIIKNFSSNANGTQPIPLYKHPVTAVPAVSITQPSQAIINSQRMRDFFGDDLPATEDFIKTFISLAKKQIQAIETAIKNNDAAAAKYYFHLLGGAAGNSGITQIYEICNKGEKSSKESNWPEAKQHLDSLNSTMKKLELEAANLNKN